MITEQEYQDLLLKNAKEYQRACELQRENNHLVDVNKTLERKLKIAEEALFFISICVKIIKGYSSPIPTREACKAYVALQKMKEVENDK